MGDGVGRVGDDVQAVRRAEAEIKVKVPAHLEVYPAVGGELQQRQPEVEADRHRDVGQILMQVHVELDRLDGVGVGRHRAPGVEERLRHAVQADEPETSRPRTENGVQRLEHEAVRSAAGARRELGGDRVEHLLPEARDELRAVLQMAADQGDVLLEHLAVQRALELREKTVEAVDQDGGVAQEPDRAGGQGRGEVRRLNRDRPVRAAEQPLQGVDTDDQVVLPRPADRDVTRRAEQRQGRVRLAVEPDAEIGGERGRQSVTPGPVGVVDRNRELREAVGTRRRVYRHRAVLDVQAERAESPLEVQIGPIHLDPERHPGPAAAVLVDGPVVQERHRQERVGQVDPEVQAERGIRLNVQVRRARGIDQLGEPLEVALDRRVVDQIDERGEVEAHRPLVVEAGLVGELDFQRGVAGDARVV